MCSCRRSSASRAPKVCSPVLVPQQRPLRHLLGVPWGPRNSAGRHPLQYALDRSSSAGRLLPTNSSRRSSPTLQTEISLGLHACLHLSRLRDCGSGARDGLAVEAPIAPDKALDIARAARHPRRQRHFDSYHVIRHLMNLETVNRWKARTTSTRSCSAARDGHLGVQLTTEGKARFSLRSSGDVSRWAGGKSKRI